MSVLGKHYITDTERYFLLALSEQYILPYRIVEGIESNTDRQQILRVNRPDPLIILASRITNILAPTAVSDLSDLAATVQHVGWEEFICRVNIGGGGRTHYL